MSGRDRVGLVAAREIRERVRARSFQITTVLVALAVIAAIVIPNLGREGQVGAPSAAARDAAVASGRLTGVRVEVVTLPDTGATEGALRADEVDLALLQGTESKGFEIVVKDKPDGDSQLGRFSAALSQSLGVQSRLQEAGLAPDVAGAALQAPPLPLRTIEAPTPERRRRAAPLGFMAAVVLYVMLLQYGTWILYGVVEEKSSRVVEVILAAVRPTQLLAGKVIGIGAVALGQSLLLAGTALVTAFAVGLDRLPEDTPATIAVALLWFVVGFSLYSFAFATVASLASRQEDAQNASFPLTAVMTFGYVVGTTAASNPDSVLARALSFFPPTAPFVMPARAATGVATWEVLLAAAISVAATVLVARLAGSLYARVILRGGSRLSLRQAWKAQPS